MAKWAKNGRMTGFFGKKAVGGHPKGREKGKSRDTPMNLAL